MRPIEDIEAALNLRTVQGSYAGLVAGLWRRGSSKFVSSGVADRRTGAPLDATSRFEIGSMGKALTGVLLGLMEEAGELSLDEPVGSFLDAHIELSPGFSEEVTLLDLATHYSGLPAMPPDLEGIDLEDRHPEYPFAALCAFLSSFVPPGARRYLYSNLGYGLLGFCLSTRAGQPFESLLRERVLLPLGMVGTGFDIREEDCVIGYAAEGHARPAWEVPALLRPAGGLRASPCDLLCLVAACMEPPAGPLGRALTSALRPRRHARASYDIGLGWETNYAFPPDAIVLKGGLTAGFSTNCLLVPSRQEGAVLLANSMQCVSDLSYYMLDGRFGLHPEPSWEPAFLASPLWRGASANSRRVNL